MTLRYLSRELIAILATLFAFVFADFIALGIKKDGRLIWPLRWASTADNPAIGDKAFNDNQFPLLNPNTWTGRYLLCRAWIRRNPAYWLDDAFGVTVKEGFTLVEDEDCTATISRDEHMLVWGIPGTYRRKLVNGDGKEYFEYCKVWMSANGIWWRVQLRWNLSPVVVGRTLLLKLTGNRW